MPWKHVVDGKLRILKPEAQHFVRPVVHIGRFERNFEHLAGLAGLVNAAFFDSPADNRPNMFGDHLTDLELAWGFTLREDEQRELDGRTVYYRPASEVAKPGYSLRWGLGGLVDGKVELVQGQPGSFSSVERFVWFLGGAALLLKDGKKPGFPSTASDPIGITSREGGQFQTDVLGKTDRSVMLVTPAGEIHLAVAVNCDPSVVSSEAKRTGYLHALMFDGGGSTLMAYRATPQSGVTKVQTTTRPLQSFLGIFEKSQLDSVTLLSSNAAADRMDTFIETLQKKRAEVNCKLREIPSVRQALDGTLNREVYSRYLERIARSYSPHSPKVMCLAASRCNSAQRQFAEYYMTHAVEEAGHDLWATHDLGSLRGAEMVTRIDPYALCEAMIGYTYYLAGHEHPLALFGWMYILEAVGADLGPDALAGLRRQEHLPLEFVGGHAEADVTHTKEMEDILESIEDPQAQEAILKAAEVSAELYVGMFSQLDADAANLG